MATAIAIITSVIFSVCITFLLMMLMSTLLNFRNFHKYKYSYELLTSGEYQFNWRGDSSMYFFAHKDMVGKYSSIDTNSDLSLVFSLNKNGKVSAIRLPTTDGNFAFIHTELPFAIDPYTKRYAKKFSKWFETNKSTFVDREDPKFILTEEEIRKIIGNENN